MWPFPIELEYILNQYCTVGTKTSPKAHETEMKYKEGPEDCFEIMLGSSICMFSYESGNDTIYSSWCDKDNKDFETRVQRWGQMSKVNTQCFIVSNNMYLKKGYSHCNTSWPVKKYTMV